MMKLIFKYDINMELDNYQRIRRSINHPNEALSRFDQLVFDLHINPNDQPAILELYKSESERFGTDFSRKAIKFKKDWDKIAALAEQRFSKLFKTSENMGAVQVFLTIRGRCAYNFKQRYFFVTALLKSVNSICLHELLHFYTYKHLFPESEKFNITFEQLNDFKEAITFLLNSEFADLMDLVEDKGYSRQAKLRQWLEVEWQKEKDLYSLRDKYLYTLNK